MTTIPKSQAPALCDICAMPIKTEFVDGGTRMGPWANMCMTCFQLYGRGLGSGRGQHYKRESEDSDFVKVEG